MLWGCGVAEHLVNLLLYTKYKNGEANNELDERPGRCGYNKIKTGSRRRGLLVCYIADEQVVGPPRWNISRSSELLTEKTRRKNWRSEDNKESITLNTCLERIDLYPKPIYPRGHLAFKVKLKQVRGKGVFVL